MNGTPQFNREFRPVLDKNKAIQDKNFEILSWQIEDGHHISFAVLQYNKESHKITDEQFGDLVRKRIEFLKIKIEEVRSVGNLQKLAEYSQELREFPEEN